MERERISAWHRCSWPDVDVSRSELVSEMFESMAAQYPREAAVEFGAESLSYSELHNLAKGFACQLRSFGAVPEAVIALVIERSIE